MKPIVNTPFGAIRGIEQESVYLFYGLRYAKPLTPQSSFSKAKPVEPWEGVYDATSLPDNPIQSAANIGLKHIDHDCLFLNIAVPKGVSNAPVMVWIHGGSYSHGGVGKNNDDVNRPEYRLDRLCKATGCVIVAINYRLNVYGFLNLSFLGKGFDINNGLTDQLLALKFLQQIIPSFGGDKDNITLFGQSAGAACVLAHMARKESHPYFHKAISMSACVEHFFSPQESEVLGRRFLKMAHIRPEQSEKLLSTPKEKLIRLADRLERSTYLHHELRCAYSPTLDESFEGKDPLHFLQGCSKPLLIGHVADEARLFVYNIPKIVIPLVAPWIRIKPEKEGGSYLERSAKAVTKHIYIRPVDELISHAEGQCFRYRFDFATEYGKRTGLGAFHVSDVPILFGMDWFCQESKLEEIFEKYAQIFAEFAKTGNPGIPEYRSPSDLFILK
ncbi:MAG: carboxylesterase/lipase family protein [Bacilli bacterium]|nr:carboxylesterase/lipase family protein [Bacilli bacterium]